MVVACDACAARYFVKDDWVRGGRWKFRCKKCDAVVRVDGRKIAPLPRTLPPPPGASPRISSMPPARTSPSGRPVPFDGWFGMNRPRPASGTGVLPPPNPPPARPRAPSAGAVEPAASKPEPSASVEIPIDVET